MRFFETLLAGHVEESALDQILVEAYKIQQDFFEQPEQPPFEMDHNAKEWRVISDATRYLATISTSDEVYDHIWKVAG